MGEFMVIAERNDSMRISFLKYSLGLVFLIFFAAVVSGCSVVDSFQPEVVEIEAGEISIKGWVNLKKSRFCVEIHLKPDAKSVTLHSLNLVLPDGSKLAPDSWKDQTPEPSQTGFSFGFGFSSGGGRHDEYGDREGDHDDGHRGGRRSTMGMGAMIPLGKKGSARTVTQGRACWMLNDRLGEAAVTKCDLEVNLARTEREEITLTTLLLSMVYHSEKAPKEEKPPEEKKKTAKDLIREIDFTQKQPVKTRSLKV